VKVDLLIVDAFIGLLKDTTIFVSTATSVAPFAGETLATLGAFDVSADCDAVVNEALKATSALPPTSVTPDVTAIA
jgi:hypothetical protein